MHHSVIFSKNLNVNHTVIEINVQFCKAASLLWNFIMIYVQYYSYNDCYNFSYIHKKNLCIKPYPHADALAADQNFQKH